MYHTVQIRKPIVASYWLQPSTNLSAFWSLIFSALRMSKSNRWFTTAPLIIFYWKSHSPLAVSILRRNSITEIIFVLSAGPRTRIFSHTLRIIGEYSTYQMIFRNWPAIINYSLIFHITTDICGILISVLNVSVIFASIIFKTIQLQKPSYPDDHIRVVFPVRVWIIRNIIIRAGNFKSEDYNIRTD